MIPPNCDAQERRVFDEQRPKSVYCEPVRRRKATTEAPKLPFLLKEAVLKDSYNAIRREDWGGDSRHAVIVKVDLPSLRTSNLLSLISGETQHDNNLRMLLAQLAEIVSDKDAYDEDFVEPTTAAFLAAQTLIFLAATDMGNVNFPKAIVSADGEGGLRIEWRCLKGDVMLVVPGNSNAPKHVYHSIGGKYDVDDASKLTLSYWLKQVAPI